MTILRCPSLSSKIKNLCLMPSFIWSLNGYSKSDSHKKYLQKLNKEIKSQFSYVENILNGQRGYSRGTLGNASSLALYVCRYFGDGIYFSDSNEVSESSTIILDSVYFLIIHDGKVQAGTDIIVSRELFNLFIEQIAGTQFSALNKRKLSARELSELNSKYLSDTASAPRFTGTMWILALTVFLILCVGGLALFILMA